MKFQDWQRMNKEVEKGGVSELRFPEFKNSGKWKNRKLNEFITERNQSSTEKLPLFSLTIENGITPKTERYERSFLVKDEDDAYKLVFPNDFAYNPMNLRFGAIARHAGNENILLSKYYNIFHCDDTVDSSFCEIYFKSNGMISHYNKVATGSLIEKRRVHFSDFLKFNIRFPTLPEQTKIAACLSSLDDLITAQTQKIAALKTHKKGLMQQFFPQEGETVPKLRFPEFRDDWKEKNGNLVFEQISNKQHNSDLPILAITQEFGAIPRELIDYKVFVTDKSVETYKVVEKGDFIISLRSFQGGIEYSEYKGICSPAYIILRKKIDVSKSYFKHFFKSERFIQQLNKNIEGLRDGKMVSYKQFSELFLPVPSKPEQQKIADCLSSLDELINAQVKKCDALKLHKKGLMQGLFPSSNEAA